MPQFASQITMKTILLCVKVVSIHVLLSSLRTFNAGQPAPLLQLSSQSPHGTRSAHQYSLPAVFPLRPTNVPVDYYSSLPSA